MRAIAKRVARIEERLSPAANTEHLCWLRVRLDAARQRIAGQEYRSEEIGATREVTRGWTLSERLQFGR